MSSNLLLIQLNEINFDLLNKYLINSRKDQFLNLKFIKKTYKCFDTYSEDEYKNLEPWIQWPSVYLGQTFDQHKIFRLGDIIYNPKKKQIFERIEEKGYKVGAISPMNADNRLKNPSYFIPDPWTNTYSDNSNFSKRLSAMFRQTVNDNANGNLSFSSILTIIETIIRTFKYKNTSYLIKLIFSCLFSPWKKSLVLDYLIHMTKMYFFKKKLPNFSSVFFNAGAHIQHHYFYNTKQIKNLPKNPKWYISPLSDPIEDMFIVYDQIIGDYLNLCRNEDKIVISTGLRQVPYSMTKFYYRLKNHSSFLNKIEIKYSKVLPRMTRDFEIIFDNDEDLKNAKKKLINIKSEKNKLSIFNEIEERDNKSLFVTLTYPHEVKKDDLISINKNLKCNFFKEIVFVAIKNGMHDSKGYVLCSPNTKFKNPTNPVHISKLQDLILSHF
jgi:hypothetical protein